MVQEQGRHPLYYGSEQLLDGAGGNDRYVREAMFGGELGPSEAASATSFREDAPTHLQLARLLALRQEVPALRRGRQYLRPISGDGVSFARTVRVVIDDSLHAQGEHLHCRFSTDPAQEGGSVEVQAGHGKQVALTVPPGGFVVYQ